MPLDIDVTVAAVAQRDDEFLIVEELIRERLVLGQPAGHLEPGESCLDAVKRETLEETGYVFMPEYVVGSYLWTNPARDVTCLRIVFAGQAEPAQGPCELDPAVRGVHWLSRAGLAHQPQRLRSAVVLTAIDDYLSGRRSELDSQIYLESNPGLSTGAIAAR